VIAESVLLNELIPFFEVNAGKRGAYLIELSFRRRSNGIDPLLE
jgi:hypothetical protein